jgi:holin-like protein
MSGFVFFIAMYLAGDYVSTYFSLPIPGAIIGLIAVLAMLIARGRVDASLKEAADSFLRYLALMLVPIGVCVIKLLDSAPVGIWKFETVLVLALVLGAVLTAKIMQGLLWLRKVQLAPLNPAASADSTG